MDEPTLLCYVDFCKAGSTIPLGKHRYALHEYVRDVRAVFQVSLSLPVRRFFPIIDLAFHPGTVVTRQQRYGTARYQLTHLWLRCSSSIPIPRSPGMVAHVGIPPGRAVSSLSQSSCAFGTHPYPRSELVFSSHSSASA